MKNAIAIGIIGLALLPNRAAAQTAVEKAAILRDFQRSVAVYTEQHERLAMFPETLDTAAPAPKIFTLPVAVVFRQLIAQAAADHPNADLHAVLKEVLPALPATLEYRLLDKNLLLHDVGADADVAVLRDAIGGWTSVTRK